MNKSIKKLLDCENDSLEEMLESTYKIYKKEQEKEWGNSCDSY